MIIFNYIFLNFNRIIFGIVLTAISFHSYAATIPANIELASKQEIVRGLNSSITNLDPGFTADTSSAIVIGDLFEGLMTENTKGEVVSALAKSYTLSDDGKVFTFNLKEANWSNGAHHSA